MACHTGSQLYPCSLKASCTYTHERWNAQISGLYCRKYNFINLVSYVTANNDAFYTLCAPAVGY